LTSTRSLLAGDPAGVEPFDELARSEHLDFGHLQIQ
jgi:hypothetical protein